MPWLCSELYPSASDVFASGTYAPSLGKGWCGWEWYKSGHTLLHCSSLRLQSQHAALSPALLRLLCAPEQSFQTAWQRDRCSVSPSAADYRSRCASLLLSGASTLVLLLLNNNTGRSPKLAGIQLPRGLGGVFPLWRYHRSDDGSQRTALENLLLSDGETLTVGRS